MPKNMMVNIAPPPLGKCAPRKQNYTKVRLSKNILWVYVAFRLVCRERSRPFRAALQIARRNEKTARHSARFYALRAAICADGSRPIPTNLSETTFLTDCLGFYAVFGILRPIHCIYMQELTRYCPNYRQITQKSTKNFSSFVGFTT